MKDKDIIALLKNRVTSGSGTQKKLAAQIGVTPAYLSYVLNGICKPGPKILKYLGLVRDVVEVSK